MRVSVFVFFILKKDQGVRPWAVHTCTKLMGIPPPAIFVSGIAQLTVVGGSNAARVDLVLRQSSLLTSTNLFVAYIKRKESSSSA